MFITTNFCSIKYYVFNLCFPFIKEDKNRKKLQRNYLTICQQLNLTFKVCWQQDVKMAGA